MKVSCLQENLAKGLNIVGRAVAARSTLPVLGNIKIETDNARLKLSATNLELGLVCWIGAKVEEEGATTVPAKTLVDLVNALPKGQVSMGYTARTQSINVSCATVNNDIKCIDAQEFPLLPGPDKEVGIELNVVDLRSAINQVVFAAAKDDARPVLTGAELRIKGGELKLAAADGFRLAVCTAHLAAPAATPITAIIPARALAELARLLGDQDELVTMYLLAAKGQVYFQLRDTVLVSQLLEGNYPDYAQLIPRSHTTRAVMTTSELRAACRAADIFARESAYSVRLSVKPGSELKPGNVELDARSAETGSNEVQVSATVEGSALDIAFNVKYLADVLNVISSESVALELSGSNAPGVVRPLGNDNFLSVIMPMHLGG